MQDKILELVNSDINIISILYDFTNNELGTEDNGSYGPVYMFETLDNQKIVNILNKSILNIQVKNTLTSDILKYFDVEIVSENQDVTLNENGFLWKIDKIPSDTIVSLKYKIKLKDEILKGNAFINRDVVYREWYSSKEISVDYTKDFIQKNVKLEKENTPKFTISETYKMKIQAVNEKNINLGIEGIDFKVIGKDAEGKIVYNKTLKTDKNGYVTVENLKTLGKLEFSIKPIVNLLGYEETDASIVQVNNDYLGLTILDVETDLENKEVDNKNRIITLKVPIKIQGFDLKLNITELNNNNVKISNTEFRIVQPKLNNKYEMEVLYGKTDENGQLLFHPSVMTKAGTYDYIISQMDEKEGYESAGNVTLRITFNNNGEITKVEKRYNDQVEITNWNNKSVDLTIGNKNVLENGFNFELDLKDTSSNTPVVGAKYTVVVTTSNNVKYTYGDNITDENGKINMILPGSGEVHIEVIEQKPAAGYQASTTSKEFSIRRQDNEVKYAYGLNSSKNNPFEVECQTVDDKVIIKLQSSLKDERNTVKVKAIDINELDGLGLMNVEFELVNTVTGKRYDSIYSDENGIVEFTIDYEAQGTYMYTLTALDVPYGYMPIQPINFNIHFDENNYIDDVNNIDNVIKIEKQTIENETAKLHTAYLEVGIGMNDDLAYYFELQLTDINNGKPIDGAEYDIEVIAGNFTRKITKRPTDASGKITTRLAVDKNVVNEITIIVEQKTSKLGYKIDSIPQEIVYNLHNNNIMHTPEAVTTSGGEGQIRYAELKGSNTIVYHHTNRQKNISDVIVNLHVTTLEKTTEAAIGGKSVSIANNVVETEEGIKQILNERGEELNETKLTSLDELTTGYASFEGLKIVGITIPEEQDYEIELVVDGNLIRCKLTFGFNEYSQMVELMNVETVWGNRLIHSKNFSSYENSNGYASDINLEIYTNYDATGNLSLDLNKKDLETKDTLNGAIYDVIIERPDGTKVVKTNIEVKEDVIELDGIYVPLHTKIYLTEKVAPIGYELNDTVELEVTSIDQYTNEVVLTKKDDNYKVQRAELTKETSIAVSNGLLQSQYTLDMYDVQENKFDFKIVTVDNNTKAGVSGFTFSIANDTGAQRVTSATDESGATITKIGGMYNDKTSPRIYTITGIKSGTYYKKLTDPIEVKVFFKSDETVDIEKTLKEQTDSKYVPGSTTKGDWQFEEMNVVDKNGNIIYYIGIVINVEAVDPLKVEIETVNKFIDTKVANVTYEITPSLKKAEGTSGTIGIANIDVCYAQIDSQRTYNISQIVPDNYISASGLNFTVAYDANGDILEMPTTTSSDLTVVSYSGKTVRLRVAIEPKVPVTITNLYYFDQTRALQGAEFKVVDKTIKTDSNGKGTDVIGAYGNNEQIKYEVSQISAPTGYAKIDPFEIIVTYNSEREITDVSLVEENNKFVTVDKTVPSNSEDYGYNASNKGIVNIKVLSYPAVAFNIKNMDRQDETKLLPGTSYEIVSTINTSGNTVTESNGIGTAYVDKSGFNTTVIYTVKETNPSVGYQDFGPEVKVEVNFDEEGYVTSANVINNPSIANIAEASIIESKSNIEDNFVINLELKNNPLIYFNITKVNKVDGTTPISNVTFEVTGVYEGEENSKDTVTTDATGNAKAKIHKSVDNKTVEYTIKETKTSPLYQGLPEDIKLQVTYDSMGRLIATDGYKIVQGNESITVTNIDVENFTMDMTITNNPILFFNITKTDKDSGQPIRDVTFEVTGVTVGEEEENSKDTVTTDYQGKASAKVFKTIANTTIEYTIKEAKKSPFYEWLSEDVKIQITYDENAKIATKYDEEGNIIQPGYKIVQGNENINITKVDVNNFIMDMQIFNEPIKQFGIHLYTDDVYDSEKKVQQGTWTAGLTTTWQNFDEKYKTTLTSGRLLENGAPAIAYGEDYQIIGEYVEGAGTRTLRLTTNNNNLPNEYYKNSQRHDSYYGLGAYNILINVTFNDEGKIVGEPQLVTGQDPYIGWVLDQRYVSVRKSGDYGISITVHYYPLLTFKINSNDMYTNEKLEASFQLSTASGINDDYTVKSGYIGPWGAYSATSSYKTNLNNAPLVTLSRIEGEDAQIVREAEDGDKEYGRYLYLYENSEPITNIQYQKYRPRYTTIWNDLKIAKLLVWYNELGEVKNIETVETYSNNNITDSKKIISSIKASTDENNPHVVAMDIEYAPITTAEIIVEDATSGEKISGIYVDPYANNTSTTNTSYEYRSMLRYTTNGQGKANWTYWGANTPEEKRIYTINLSQIKAGYYGSDSGEEAFRTIQVEVEYNNDGKIGGATILSKDGFHNVSAYVDESCYGTTQLKLNLKLQRKVGMKINKLDKYDTNTKLSAKFDITNNLDTNVTYSLSSANTDRQLIGRMLANKTVEYTISETTVPDGYKPLDQNLKLIVKYASDGTISSAYAGDDYSKQYLKIDYICKDTRGNNSLLYKDIEISILNEPKVAIELELADKFYNNVKLDNITFNIENSKGDQAVGNLVTDTSGKIYTYVGAVYPNETVKYKMTQSSKINGYYKLGQTIEFSITFDSTGKPVDIPTLSDEYSKEYASILNTNLTQFRNNYTAKIRLYNMPEKVYLGIHKYDVTTNANLENVQFKVTVEENGRTRDINNIKTNSVGEAVVELDTFKEGQGERSVIYTIKEVQTLDSYRKVQDFKIQVLYEAKGGIRSWQVLSNESNIGYSVYKRGNTSITKIENIYTHMKLNVANDNSYDLIIKNEDINYSGLGVQGTSYNVTINGVQKNLGQTSQDGYTRINNILDTGNVQIRISEGSIGEGYKQSTQNDITLEVLRPAVGEYELKLNKDNMTNYTITDLPSDRLNEKKYDVQLTDTTHAIVIVNEEYGQLTVILYNETKLELTLMKQDLFTKEALKDVKFKITKLNVETNEEEELTAQSLTNEDGEIYFYLGVAPQNANYKYTFTELEVPQGDYENIIPPQTVTVHFDAQGKITSMETDSRRRTKAFLEGGENSRSIIVTIGNGEDKVLVGPGGGPGGTGDPEYAIPYKVKVATEDADTGRRINGSKIDVEVKDNQSQTLTQLPKPNGNSTQLPDNVTANLGADGKFHTDEEVNTKKIRIVEKGIIVTDNITTTGKIEIDISQKEFASGYIPGEQKTNGKVKLDVDIIDNSGEKELIASVTENAGLDVRVDEQSREILITIKNESSVALNIKKVNLQKIPTDEGERIVENPIQGAKYTVTSEILTATNSTKTDLNVETRETGVDGITKEAIGNAYPGKTVVYTIHEEPIEGYKPIEDIQIAVVYNFKEEISYVELLSAYADILNWTDIANTLIGGRNIDLTIIGNKIVEDYRVVVEKHNIDNDIYQDLIPGAEYEIEVKEQFGITRKWTTVTNAEGKIISGYFDGYGTIKITLIEKTAPYGYKLDSSPKYITLFRDKETGTIQKYSSDVNIDISSDNRVVTLMPLDEQADNNYTIILDKIDADTRNKITKDSAQFEVTITKTDTVEVVGNENTNNTEQEPVQGDNTQGVNQTTTQQVVSYKQTLDVMETNSEGRTTLKAIKTPEEPGEYLYTIKEIKVPNGYSKDPEEISFKVTFIKDENDVITIKQVEKISGKYAEILTVRPQTLAFTIGNKNENLVPKEDEFVLNINKVNEENEPIKDIAIFKIINPDGSTQYVETDELGIAIKNLKMPNEATTKEYKIQEVMAPNGYIINRGLINMTIEFVEDENGKVILNADNIRIRAEGSNVSKAELVDGIIKLNVKNKKGTLVNDQDRGKYNIILTKIDADTKQVIPKEAEISVALENGQRIQSRTKEDGKIEILEISAPALAGEYEYVINETKAPEGYELNKDSHIFKITFEEDKTDPTKLVITNVQEVIDDTNVSIIEVTSFENNTVRINVENTKDSNKLYLKSKVNDADEVIYNVYQKEDLPFKMPFEQEHDISDADGVKLYRVDVPVIDTKTILKAVSDNFNGITVKEFIDNLDTNADRVIIYDYDGNELEETDIMKTEYKLKAIKGNDELNFTIVVKGDIQDRKLVNSGDGWLTNSDATKIKEVLGDRKNNAFNNLTLFQKMAADIDNNGIITNADATAIKIELQKR